MLYGGIVGQKVENTDLRHEDVFRALEVCTVINIIPSFITMT